MEHIVYDRPSLRMRKPIATVRDGDGYVIVRHKWVQKPGWDHFTCVLQIQAGDLKGWIDGEKTS